MCERCEWVVLDEERRVEIGADMLELATTYQDEAPLLAWCLQVMGASIIGDPLGLVTCQASLEVARKLEIARLFETKTMLEDLVEELEGQADQGMQAIEDLMQGWIDEGGHVDMEGDNHD